MATGSIRSTFKQALVDSLGLQAGLAQVQIQYGWPGDTLEKDSVWLGGCNGQLSIPVLQAGRKQRDDEFTVDVYIATGTRGMTAVEADTKVVEYLSALDSVLANDPQLLTLDGLVAAVVTNIQGPDPSLTAEGASSFATATVSVHARYV